MNLLGCGIGYTSENGLTCYKCPQPFYGFHCAHKCSCSDDQICDHIIGCTIETKKGSTTDGGSDADISHQRDVKQSDDKDKPTERKTNIYGTYQLKRLRTEVDEYEFDSDNEEDEDPYAVIRDSQVLPQTTDTETDVNYDQYNTCGYNYLHLMGLPRPPGLQKKIKGSYSSADDLSKSKLPIGQQKLLIKSVRQTFLQSEEENDGDLPKRTSMADNNEELPASSSAGAHADINVSSGTNNGLPAPTEPEVTANYIRDVLGQLQKQQPQHGGHVSNCSTNNTGSSLDLNDNISWQDPQIYLKSLNSSGSSVVYYDIVDFVQSSGGFFDEEKLISKSDCGQLVFKSGPSKPKLETVTMCQWSMANLAILHKLLGEGLLDQGQVLDYLSYTTRIYQLITSHDMVSVFFYDREYRRLQSMHRFRWGTDIPHIQMVYLKPRAARYSQQTNTQPKGSGASTRGPEIMRPIPPVAKRFVGSLTLDMAALLPLPSEFKSKKLGNTVKPLRALELHVWSRELANDFDREFLLNGIEFGFDIIDCDQLPSSIISKNHPSASPNNPLYEKAHTQVLNEIECGNYKFTSSDPCIISPIGVIPKQDGGIRLIHDCSRPKGSSVNSLVSEIEKQRFQTLDDAAKLVTKNCFMSKVDLKSAYRSVKLSQRSQKVTGFNWTFPKGQEFTLYDIKLPFDSKLAPSIFHRLTQAVRRMMSRRGFTVVAYLNDFFLCEQSEFRCRQALNSLIFLLRELGFMINWQKVVDPTTKLTF
ncbi:unnamed protein product [Mytilus coruscus]|uniref:Reverse transcriptase domain-containing protein n=1 Tax=Mytilus coruscus TaxID=42192 RepID=A0A6J8ES53_MYTCO|nr:unnamed protein product [Mytilus coruscus]